MASTSTFKMESGIQLLTRLRRKPKIDFLYPNLFETGPKFGEVVELYSSVSTSFLLIDIISEALIPTSLGGREVGVLIFNTDGNLDYHQLIQTITNKITSRVKSSNYSFESIQNLLNGTLSNLHVFQIYDKTQFNVTILNMENILSDHSDISLVLFDTLTGFYWSEQGHKITKTDVYVKSLLHMIQKVSKEYNITIIYTRPEYFSSNKDAIENLEPCSEQPTLEKINYRIQSQLDEEGEYKVNVRTYNKIFQKKCTVAGDCIKWL